MSNYHPLVDLSNVDTPANMDPALPVAGITHIPARGTGLAGEVYITNGWIGSIETLQEIIDTKPPIMTFTSTQIAYAGKSSSTTVAEFLAHDADSIEQPYGDLFEMGPSGIKLTGYVYIPEGKHEVSVVSDDGFAMKIGGVEYSSYSGTRSVDEIGRVAEFDGGLYEIEIIYFDGSGGQALMLEIDGLPVDQSAFYQSVSDFTNPPADIPLVPVDDYHPSAFIDDALDIETTDIATDGIDQINGGGADETIDGLDGDDVITGGYGDDKIVGGDGDDVIDGGRGSDLLIGGAGNDLLISRSDAGEQRIGQLAIGEPTRGDPDGEVDAARQKLKGYENQAFAADDMMVGGTGQDTFLIAPQINAKLEIIQKHTRWDGSINWAGVAGENDEVHDHWVDAFGIEVIADYVKADDQIAVIGHTANIDRIEYRDIDGDGYDESIITVISNQGGGGGAHDQDYLGQIIVFGDMVFEEDIITNAGVTYGIVQTYADIEEAIFPVGETKVTTINGQTVYGYDTRDTNGNLGAITGSPEDFIDNAFYDDAGAHGITFGDPTEEGAELTRGSFEPLEIIAGAGVTRTGGSGDDVMGQAVSAVPGLPGALAYFQFSETGTLDGTYDDARGGPSLKTYTQWENQAILRTDAITTGPDGVTQNAIEFNGTTEFAFLQHDNLMNVSQGTIALWVRPDDLSRPGTFVSKDQSGSGKGGHFRLGHDDDGNLFLRFAQGDGRWGSNTWETMSPVLTEGDWNHIAVSFTDTGVVVYLDGVAISDALWKSVEGGVASPGAFTEAYLIQNEEPWVLGADSYRAEANDTAQVFATTDTKLQKAFDGAIAEFGVWGGFTPGDALSQGEVVELMTDGPGTALTNPSGPQPMVAADDTLDGAGGDDMIDGGAGDDLLIGGAGDDSIKGGYGDDRLEGGAGNDTLDGGRGSDLVMGGDGDDLLIARSDAGEQRAGQLVLGEPSRDYPDPSIDPQYLKLVDWVDQPFAADDVLVGGAGADHFLIEPLINAKKDTILKHVEEDRSIDWKGVAGENNRIHDHWVDLFGIDIIADYDRDEDTISIVGHTANILDIDYKAIDTNGDGMMDDAVSIISVYSQQGKNGGAHDEDMLGYVVVHGDLVTEDDIQTNPGSNNGIVQTVDDLQEAIAPTGETKVSVTDDGTSLFGYDTRDVPGDPMASDPEAFSSNPFLAAGEVTFRSAIDGLPPASMVIDHDGGTFDGTDGYVEIPHDPAQQLAAGTWAFTFTVDDLEKGHDQVLLSKDHRGYEDGGHLAVYLTSSGHLKVRFQSETESRYLVDWGQKIEPGQEYHVAFTFDEDTIALYLDGRIIDADSGFPDGMLGNTESTVIGASTRDRDGVNDNLTDFFGGEIGNVAVFDRALDPVEVVILAQAPADTAAISAPLEIIGDDGQNNLTGSVLNEYLDGKGGDDWLFGAGGSDVLQGGSGADTMVGGQGSDMYYLDDAGDVVIEAPDEGHDVVFSSVSVALRDHSQHLHDLTLTGSADIDGTGNWQDNRITGNSGDNVLNGAWGNDILDGGDGNDTFRDDLGADTMIGGRGDDTFYWDDANDAIVEYAGEGHDAVYSSMSAELRSLGQYIEDLVLTGSGDIDGTGNGLANWIEGNSGNNVLNGAAGDDTLRGGAGNDTFDDESGADRMIGGGGDDTYYVDDIGDRVVEWNLPGHDRVFSSVSFALRDHGQNIEDLILTGSADIDGTGNALSNAVTGNAGDNVLNGAWGNDILTGGAGNDTFRDDAGADTMIGGVGDDTYHVDNAGDVLIESAGEGHDTVLSSVSIALRDHSQHLDDLTLVGTADIDGTGNWQNNVITGNSGDNVLNGAWGQDTLSGGGGNDTFMFDAALAAANADLIVDFRSGEDRIGLSSNVYTALGAGTPAADAVVIGTAASDADDRLIFDASTGTLSYDADGSGAAAAQQIAVLAGVTSLTADDIWVY